MGPVGAGAVKLPAHAAPPAPRVRLCADATFGGSANISSGLPSFVIVASSTMTLARLFCEGRSYITSSSTCSRIERRPRAPVLRASALAAIARSAPSRISSSTPSMRNIFWYCLVSAFLGSTRIWISADSSSSSSVATTGRRPTNSGMSPNLIRSSGSHSRKQRADVLAVVRARDLGSEADAGLRRPLADDLLESVERAAADEQDVGRVDLDELLVRVLAPALRRHRRDRALDQLQERLLDALAGDVARDGRVVALPGNLVDLVDVDDAPLRLLDVVVALLQELLDDVLDVLADVARLGQRGRVGDHERHVEEPRERLREQRLAGPRGADQQDVALRELDLVVLAARFPAACSGCRRRPKVSSSRGPGRSRTGRGCRGSRAAWAACSCRCAPSPRWCLPRG